MILYLIFLFVLFVAPIIWYNYIFKKNDKVLINMPFNGLEFGQELLQEYSLNDVNFVSTNDSQIGFVEIDNNHFVEAEVV